MKKCIYKHLGKVIIFFIGCLFIIALLLNHIDAAFSLLGSAILVCYAMYEYSLKYKEQIERDILKEQKEQYNNFRLTISKLEQLLHEIAGSSNDVSLAILSEELTRELLKKSKNENKCCLSEILESSDYYFLLESTIGTVQIQNKTVKSLIKYRNQIFILLAELSNIVPVYSILLAGLFNLLFVYKQGRVSIQQIKRIFYDEETYKKLINVLNITTTNLPLNTRIHYFLCYYLIRMPVLYTNKKIPLTEEIANKLILLIQVLLLEYKSLDENKLKDLCKLQESKQREIVSNYDTFLSDCLHIFSLIQQDFSSQTRSQIINLLNEIVFSIFIIPV